MIFLENLKTEGGRGAGVGYQRRHSKRDGDWPTENTSEKNSLVKGHYLFGIALKPPASLMDETQVEAKFFLESSFRGDT